MRRMYSVLPVLVFLAATLVAPLAGQDPTPAEIHLAHLLDGFVSLPDGMGLVAAAMGEAQVVTQHAALGAQDPTNLQSMQLHANHIVHAIDPRVVRTGPGLGYGLLKATRDIQRHAELAARAQGATPGVVTHSLHVATSARNTERRADRIIALAQTIAEHVDSPDDAAALYEDLRTLADALLTGVDANGDGQIGWQEGEGGLQIVEQHANFMRQAARTTP